MASDKQINIGVGTDISGLKTGMDSAAKTVQDAGKKMETAAKEATAKTESSFSNLRQAYRATAKDALSFLVFYIYSLFIVYNVNW